MSSVLFDAPGPRARVRQWIYSIIAAIVVLAILGFIAFRMDRNGQFAYELWEPFVTPRYIDYIGEQTLATLRMALVAILAAIAFGLVFGSGKLSDHVIVRWPCWLVVEFFRAIPLLLLIIFIYYIWGIDKGESGSYWSVVFGLVLYNGAVLAEVFRAGVNSVPKGQSEASYAIGLRKTQVMRIVLLPQAVKAMLPAIISQMVVALKDTSLGFTILAPGLTMVYKELPRDFGNENLLQTALVVSAIYIVINLILSWIATQVQKRLVGERKQLEVAAIGGTYASGAGGAGGAGVAI